MYSQIVIARNLDEFEAKNRWRPKYHSLEEILEFKKYVESITTTDSNARNTYVTVTRSLTQRRQKEIKRWIQNEQVLCTLDSGYWEDRFAYLCDEKGEILKFKNRKSQEVVDSVLAEFDEQNVSMEMLFIKGRQVGLTSKTALKFEQRLLFIPHTQAVMASVQQEKSELIGRILQICLERQPWWLIPRQTTDRLKMWAWENGSVLSVQSGAQATGIAQGWTPTCLVSSSYIRLADGVIKPIVDVVSGDCIYTHTGAKAFVINSFETQRLDKRTRKIKIWGDQIPLECTNDHKIFTPHGWEQAGKLRPGDYVHYPVRRISSTLYFGSAYKMSRGSVRDYRKEEFQFPLDYNMGYLCGFYLAEGCVHYSAVGHKTKIPYPSEINLSIHEREIDKTLVAVKSVLGEKQKILVKHKNDHGAQITFSCAWLARWLSINFKEGAANKIVPDWIWKCSEDFCKGLLIGYVDGDGHCEKVSNKVITISISHALIIQMRDLAASLGLGWSSVYRRTKTSDNHRQSYALVMTGPTGTEYRRLTGGESVRKPRNGIPRYWKYSDDKTSIWLKIKSINESMAEHFYDLDIGHPDHSFVTHQCSVHNCVHLSELADVPNPKKTIEEGLFHAVHSSAKLFMVLEGTGGGNTGWLADTWRQAKKGWPLGRSRLRPIFIPWFMATDLYPEADWLRKFPIPERWDACRETRKHTQRCELFANNTDYLSRVFEPELEDAPRAAMVLGIQLSRRRRKAYSKSMASADARRRYGSPDRQERHGIRAGSHRSPNKRAQAGIPGIRRHRQHD